MNPTLTAQNGNIMTGTLPTNASGFTPTGDIIYNTAPKAPSNSSVITSAPASEAYKQSAAWIANEQSQAAVRAANAKLAEQQAAAANAAAAGKNRTTQVAVDALSGFQRTGQGDELTAGEKARVDEINQIGSQLKTLATQMDTRASAQIDAVIKEYDSLSKRQEVANAQYEGGTSTAGLVSGRSRYAPEIQAGVQSAAVASGIQALTDIQMKKQKVIMEIEQARDAQQYKMLTDRVQELKTLKKEEREAAQQMTENFYKEQQYMRENGKYQAEINAPYLASMMTGDPTKDNELLNQAAQQLGVSVSSLAFGVDSYKQKLSQANDTPDIKEYNFALQRGDIPKSTSFLDWQVKNANLKARSSGTGDEKTNSTADSVFSIYGSNIKDYMSQGLTPSQAVQAVAVQSKDAGTSLTPAVQAALLQRANLLVQGGSSAPSGNEESPLPGESAGSFALGTLDELALATGLKTQGEFDRAEQRRSSSTSKRDQILKQWSYYKRLGRELTAAEKGIVTGIRRDAQLNGITLP